MGNILQNSLDVTYEDFLKGVFGAKAKPEWNALKTLFSEIVVGKSTLVSDMSKTLRGSRGRTIVVEYRWWSIVPDSAVAALDAWRRGLLYLHP